MNSALRKCEVSEHFPHKIGSRLLSEVVKTKIQAILDALLHLLGSTQKSETQDARSAQFSNNPVLRELLTSVIL